MKNGSKKCCRKVFLDIEFFVYFGWLIVIVLPKILFEVYFITYTAYFHVRSN